MAEKRKSQILGVLFCEMFFLFQRVKENNKKRQRSALLARYREVCALKSKQNADHKTARTNLRCPFLGLVTSL